MSANEGLRGSANVFIGIGILFSGAEVGVGAYPAFFHEARIIVYVWKEDTECSERENWAAVLQNPDCVRLPPGEKLRVQEEDFTHVLSDSVIP